MVGYWAPSCPVTTDRDDVLATAYIKDGEAMIALASWASRDVEVELSIDWGALGIDPAVATIVAPAIEKFQLAASFALGKAIPVPRGKGWLLIVSEGKDK